MNRDDSGLLRAMLQEGLLTESQGRRVARALQHGATLEEALGRTPLVDPLDYQKMMRQSPAPVAEIQSDSQRSDAVSRVLVATYDLAEHEEIPLVMRLYELLGEVFYGGMQGLEIGRVGMEAGWSRFFDAQGRCIEERPLDPNQAEKMIARLRVMGRLVPTRRDEQRSFIGLKGNGLEGQVLLASHGDAIRMHFETRTSG